VRREADLSHPIKEETVRKLVAAGFCVLVLVGVLAPAASANSSPPPTGGMSSRLSMTAKITRFRATAAGVVADGVMTGKLRSGTKVTNDSAPVRFAVDANQTGARCDVITLRLAQLNLELLGVQVTTSHINLDVYALKGRVLGDLFCALAHAKVTFPRAAREARALNSRLHGHSLPVFSSSDSLPARAAQAQPQSCQVLNLILGPLHLDLLGLVVDLYGKTHNDPVVVTINALPNKGLLGQLLCGLAGGGGGVTSLSGLQSLLSSLGLNLSTGVLGNLLHQLGIGNLSGGLSQLDLNRILQALGLGETGGITSVAGLQNLLNGFGDSLSTSQVQNLLNQLGITNLSSGLSQQDLARILKALGLGSTNPSG
jgi:hypothetical protein